MLFALIPLRAALGAAPLQLMGMGPSNYASACNAAPWELERSPHNAHNIKYIGPFQTGSSSEFRVH